MREACFCGARVVIEESNMNMKRRQFMLGCASTMVGGLGFAGREPAPWQRLPRTKDGVETLGTARNLIYILLEGGPSHVDTFDLKPGSYTPSFIGPENIGGLAWPTGTMPKLAQMTDRFSIVRSISADEAVHSRAVYHLLTAHRQNVALMSDVPHFASMLSFKLEPQRQPGQSLPNVMMIGVNPAKNGFLPMSHLGLELSPEGGVANLEHEFYGEERRFELLSQLWDASSGIKDTRADNIQFQKQARVMMLDPDLKSLLSVGEQEETDDPVVLFKRQCETAVRVIAANKGTRVFQLQLEGWDHHIAIYTPNDFYGLQRLSMAFDEGFSYLIESLSAQPAHGGEPGTLLDQTLIVAVGEFGRTTGALNSSGGRDHFPNVVPAVMAGGGVKPGRVIGATSSMGNVITDPGWQRTRYMGINDLAATIYSAMGIDWTERFSETPSGRTFEIVDTSQSGPANPIDQLFV